MTIPGTDGIARFIEDRLRDDEAAAREGQPDPANAESAMWVAYGHPPGPQDKRQDRRVHLVGAEPADMTAGWAVCEVGQFDRAPMIAAHIARHDPARVLREVAAKRERLALMLDATAEMNRLLADPTAGHAEQAMAVGRACAATVAVKHDAAIHRDHPDYQAAWKP